MKPGLKITPGYTLIELTVVVCLISTMLYLILPRLENRLFSGNIHKTVRWIIGTTHSLKSDAVRKQKQITLVFNLDESRIWVASEADREEEPPSSGKTVYILPSDVKIMDIEYPLREKITFGRAEINFHPKGYSDKALIHLEDEDGNQVSLIIEPFLSKVAFYEEYIRFEE